MTSDNTSGVVDRLLAGVEAGSIPDGLFAPDAVLDATVPNWRLSVRGSDAIRDQLSRWYAEQGQLVSVDRAPIPEGELVEFTLTWSEQGVDYTAHQAHILRVAGNRILADTMFCGGRWPASLVAEMEQAQGVATA
jgi:hypothetical protein